MEEGKRKFYGAAIASSLTDIENCQKIAN